MMPHHPVQPMLVPNPVRSQMVTVPSSASLQQSMCYGQPLVQMTSAIWTQSQYPNVNLQHPEVFSSSIPWTPNPLVNNQLILMASPECPPISQATLIPPPTTNLVPPPEFFSIPVNFPTANCTPECCPPNMTLAYVPTHLIQMAQEKVHQYTEGHLVQVEAGQSNYSYMDMTQSSYPPSSIGGGNVVYPPMFGPGGWPMTVQATNKTGSSSSKTMKPTKSFSERKNICGFCKSNREPKEVYKSHRLKNETGEVNCPILRRYVCPQCQQTGDQAHTISYCPLNANTRPATGGGENTIERRLVRNSTGKMYMLKY